MTTVIDTVELDESEIQFKFVRSPGPGGQHVNKTATAVQLRFNVKKTNSLPDDIRLRLLQKARNRINREGVLIINANRFRSQDLNRKDALERLKTIIAESAHITKSRRKTKPTFASVKKRRESKSRRSKLKQTRRRVFD